MCPAASSIPKSNESSIALKSASNPHSIENWSACPPGTCCAGVKYGSSEYFSTSVCVMNGGMN